MGAKGASRLGVLRDKLNAFGECALVLWKTARGPSVGLHPAVQLSICTLGRCCPCGWVGGTPASLDLRPRDSLLLADIVAAGVEPSVQRPWPGHKGRDYSVFSQWLEGGRPGFCGLKPERFIKLPFSFLAAAQGLQHCLLGTGIDLFASISILSVTISLISLKGDSQDSNPQI